jgi:hypothetical protein
VDGTLNVNETVGLANEAARTILTGPVARALSETA